MDLNWIDYTILGIIAFSTLISLVRGFIREVLSLIIWAGALWIAYKFAGPFANQFLNTFESETLRYPLAFFIVFLMVLITGAIANYAIGRLVYQTGLSGTDRVLGLAFGLARGVLLVGVLLLAAALTNMNQNPAWAESKILPQFNGLVNWLYAMLPEKIEAIANIAQKEAEQKLGLADKTQPSDQKIDAEKTVQQPESPRTPSPFGDPAVAPANADSVFSTPSSVSVSDNSNASGGIR